MFKFEIRLSILFAINEAEGLVKRADNVDSPTPSFPPTHKYTLGEPMEPTKV